MTDKDLRRMSRRELLELLLYQMEENERLRNQLNKANKKLKSRSIIIEEAGSIAEAALKLNGVFEAAQEAASQYLENIRRLEEEAQDRLGLEDVDIDDLDADEVGTDEPDVCEASDSEQDEGDESA